MKTPTDSPLQDLDARIALAEAKLVARQQQLQLQWQGLQARIESATQPRKLAVPVAAALGVLALWWLLGRGDHQREVRPRPRHDGLLSSLARWMRWMPLLLPLLPLQWRERLEPATAGGMLGLTLPLVRRVRQAWQRPEQGRPPTTVAAVDLQRYTGRWHEIARLPVRYESDCAAQPTAEYRLMPQGLQVVNRCRTASGRERVAHGWARVAPHSRGARLKVSFAPSWLHWLPAVWADYWILHVGADYDIALVGTPARDALWLLSREPVISVAQFRELIGVARQQGYDLRNLRFS